MGLFDYFRAKPQAGPQDEALAIEYKQEVLRAATELANRWVGFEALNQPISDDADQADWKIPNSDAIEGTTSELRDSARKLAYQPNCRRALELYRYYLAGNGFTVTLSPRDKDKEQTEEEQTFLREVDALWQDVLRANVAGFSVDEWMRRTYRDGETFVWLKSAEAAAWPPKVRFIDPERIADKNGIEEEGIVTDPNDVASYTSFLLYEEGSKTALPIPAEDVIFVKLDTDSTTKRGQTRLAGVIDTAKMLMGTVRNEVILRNLQSSIVLQRKVAGGRQAVLGITDHASTGSTNYPEQTLSREKIRPGSVVTTSAGVELEFKQPTNNFSDASPLISMLIRQISSVTGWTYEQLSADTSQGNLASALSQESPTLQMVKAEMEFHLPHLERLYRWFIRVAVLTGQIEMDEEQVWEDYTVEVRFGDPTSEDPLKRAQRLNLLTMSQTGSHAEARRQLGLSNDRMEQELADEQKSGLYNSALTGQNPDTGDASSSSQSNAQGGSGTNQGDQMPVGHDDNRNAKGDQ